MNRRLLISSLAALALAAATAFASKPITMKGSDTMVILGQRWAEKYMNEHAGQVIMVTGGGSGTGIAALINGTTDICQASRTMKPDEKLKLRDRYQTMGTEIPVAKDGLTIYLHSDNPVKQLAVPGRQTEILRAAFSRDGARLATAEYRLLVALRDGATLDAACTMVVSESPNDPAWPDRLREWFTSWTGLGWLCKRK